MRRAKGMLGTVGVTALLVGIGLFAADEVTPPGEKPDVKPDMKKVSYCIGLSIGKSMKSQDLTLEVEDFLAGLRHGLAGDAPRMTEEDMRTAMTAFEQDMRVREADRTRREAEDNRTKGEAYLAQNKTKPGVKVLPSGLQYKVLKAGAGKQPKAADTVTVLYRGTFIDGTEFDSSHKRGEPVTFPVNGVIPGWTEALQLMKEGDKWELVIPAGLAYGERGAGGVIAPNAVLVFEVELIAVK